MKFRNISALLLAMVMVLSLAACGSEEEAPASVPAETAAAATEAAPAATEAAVPETESAVEEENALLRGHDGIMEITLGAFEEGQSKALCKITVPTDAMFTGAIQLTAEDIITLDSKSLTEHQSELDFSTTVLTTASFSMEKSSIGILAYPSASLSIASTKEQNADGVDLEAAFPAYAVKLQPNDENPEASVQVVAEMGSYSVVISYTGELMDSMDLSILGQHLAELVLPLN